MKTVATTRIAVDPDIRGGRPHLAGSRITVADVVLMHLRLGQSLEEIAGKYDLPLASLHAAMSYYYDHQEEVDGSIREDVEFEQAFRRDNSFSIAGEVDGRAARWLSGSVFIWTGRSNPISLGLSASTE